MPKDKTETHERIIPAAMKIFLEKGFEKATMREIAEESGITAAGRFSRWGGVSPAASLFRARARSNPVIFPPPCQRIR